MLEINYLANSKLIPEHVIKYENRYTKQFTILKHFPQMLFYFNLNKKLIVWTDEHKLMRHDMNSKILDTVRSYRFMEIAHLNNAPFTLHVNGAVESTGRIYPSRGLTNCGAEPFFTFFSFRFFLLSILVSSVSSGLVSSTSDLKICLIVLIHAS